MRRLLCCCVLFCLLGLPGAAQAQASGFLGGPLVAFTTADQSQVLLYDQRSGSTRALNFGAFWHVVWGFSPDGCRLLLTLGEGIAAPQRLYSARLDGSDLTPLLDYTELPPERWSAFEPAWSPVTPGQPGRIAFTLIRDYPQQDGTVERQYHLAWIADDAGFPQTPQFYSVSGDEHTPQWSPDGQWLAYTSYDERVPGADVFSTAAPTPAPPPGTTPVPGTLLREADLWAVSFDGATKYRLTTFPTGSISNPRWSPDSTLVSFVYSPSPSNDMFWMIANAPEAIPTQLSSQWALILDMTWLPDNTAILASVRDFRDMPENRLWRIPLVGLADTDAVPYLNDPALAHTDFPRFSPDGRWLALRSEYTLVLYDTTTGAWTPLPDSAGNTPPFWSPAAFVGEAACG